MARVTSPNKPPVSQLPGCFVVQTAGARATGLTAEEVVALLESPEGSAAEIFRIHRVLDDGRLELVGVDAQSFASRSAYLFFRGSVVEARADFDAIVALSAHAPPPCRVELHLARARGLQPEHVVALSFVAPCEEAVGQWLRRCERPPGSHVDAGPAALAAYEAGQAQVVKQATLESPVRGGSLLDQHGVK